MNLYIDTSTPPLKGSRRMRGLNIAKMLDCRFGDIEQDYKTIKNSNVIFIRRHPPHLSTSIINHLKSNNNKIILDFLDSSELAIKNENWFDLIITNNKDMNRFFKTKTHTIYHGWDSDLHKKIKLEPSKELKAYFFGCPDKTYFYKDFPDLGIIDAKTLKGEYDLHNHKNMDSVIYDGSINISIRKGYTSSGDHHDVLASWETSTKVATAAMLDNLIISSRSPSSLEILGEDYPYYADTLTELKEKLNKCKQDIKNKTEEYFLSKQIMGQAKEMLSPEKLIYRWKSIDEKL